MIKLYWYLTGYIRKHGLKFLAIVVLAVVLFSFVIPYLFERLTPHKRRYIGIVGEYNLNNLPLMIRQQLSYGLVTTEPDGSFVPVLGTLKIENSGLRYRFTLSQDYYWQDGRPLVATDIDYHVPDATVTYQDNEVIYDLPEVFASFPQLLTAPLLRYQTDTRWGLWEEVDIYGLSHTRLTDYTFADRSHRSLSQVVLDDTQTGERYIYRFYFTQDQAIDAFKLGEVDYLFDVTNIEEIKNWQTTVVQDRLLPDQYLAVFFNTADPLLSRNLRQALSYAVEKERPGYTRAAGPISADSWAYFAGVKKYDKNIDSGVERLLDELPGEPIELELITTTSYFDIASRIKQDWEELGEAAATACLESDDIKDKTPCEYLRIKVQIQIQSFPDTNNFQTLLIGHQVATDPDQYNLWHSDLATNFTHYKNTRVDNFLEKGRQTINPQERLTLYQEFQQALLEDPPAIFLWHLQSSDLARK